MNNIYIIDYAIHTVVSNEVSDHFQLTDSVYLVNNIWSLLSNTKEKKRAPHLHLKTLFCNIYNDNYSLLKNNTALVCGSGFFDVMNNDNINLKISESIDQLADDFGINGPVIKLSTACSSGASAVISGIQLLKSGLAENVIVCAYDFKNIIAEMGMWRIGALTKSQIKPFDSSRDGTKLAEGIGILILSKNRSNEKSVKILSYGVSTDAFNVTSPNPNGKALENAMNKALEESHINKEDIAYINAHGSGTKLNDVLETEVIKKVFGDHAYNLYINSSKSQIGHTLGAAGLIELIITIYSMENSIIHPTFNTNDIDVMCDLNYCTKELIHKDINYAMSNSIGFGGTNICLLLGIE